MSWYNNYAPYVTVAERRIKGQKQLKKLEKQGLEVEPLGELTHRQKIAASFWGRSWCQHLESFSDYENRLPRGRTYVRNGSVLHLAITPGTVSALVQGSELYHQTIRILPLATEKWERIKSKCQGKIGSLIELLQGKISDEIMAIVTDPDDGLFPSPKEIKLICSCPDSAHMCKHVAAVLYGVGARLDTQPELLFKLREVDHNDLIAAAEAPASLTGKGRGGRRRLDAEAVGSVFGIDLDGEIPPAPTASKALQTAPESLPAKSKVEPPARKPAAIKTRKVKPAAKPKALPFRPTGALIRKLRSHLDLTARELGDELRVPAKLIAKWETQRGHLVMDEAPKRLLQKIYLSNLSV
jgi:uncharacterized Zn finger protein